MTKFQNNVNYSVIYIRCSEVHNNLKLIFHDTGLNLEHTLRGFNNFT